MSKRLLTAALLPLLVVACDNPAGSGSGRVAVRFASAAPSRASLAPTASRSATAGELVVTGSNGTLRISDVRFIVSELELEQDEDACEAASARECEEFEAPPSFVQLPLEGGAVTVATNAIPAGTYTELDFEVEDVEIDDDDDDDRDAQKQQQIRDLFNTIRATFADWPNKASMVVVGTFTPTGSTQAIPFRTYFDAEIEVELDLNPALVVSESGANRTLTVDVQPGLWFRRADGRVMDLAALDFTKTRRLVEFELELERGFSDVDVDDDD